MKKLLFLFSLIIQLSSFAQRVIKEDCVGTSNDELIIKIHENNDSSTSFIIKADNQNDEYNDIYSVRLIKLNRNKEVIMNREIDSLFGNINDDRNIEFDDDGSFLVVSTFIDTLSAPTTPIVRAIKFDKNGNYLWIADSTSMYDYYLYELQIKKTSNGGYILKGSFGNSYENKIICIDNLGKYQWRKTISLNELLPSATIPSYGLNVTPLKNGNTVIHYSVSSRNWVGWLDSSISVISLINHTGNEIANDTFGSKFYFQSSGSSDSRNVNFYFDLKFRVDTIVNAFRTMYNGSDLSVIRTDSSNNFYEFLPNVTNPTIMVFTDTSNIITLPYSSNDSLVYCKNLQNQLLWSYPYTSAQFNNGLYKITDNYSVLINKTYISNGIKKWESDADLSETLFYQNKYWKTISKSIEKYGNDYYYLYQYADTICSFCAELPDIKNLIVIQLLDMNTGIIKEKMIIEPKSIYAGYVRYYDKGKAMLVAGSTDLCNFGLYDIYLAYYENEFNTIKGIAYIDYNDNNTKESNEPIYPYGFVTTTSIRDTQTQHLSSSFPFIFFTDTGSYTTRLSLYNDYYISAPVQFVTSYNTYDNIDTLLFALQPRATINDVSIQLVNNWMTRLGQNNEYTVSVENKGTTIANGKVKVLMDARLLDITTSPNYAFRNGDTLVWNIGNLTPLQKGLATISFTGETPTVLNAGDTIISKAWYESDSIDLTPIDNYAEAKEIIRASYDPNEKAILSGEILTPTQVSNGNYISYIIHFQNKGNDTAFKVIVMDTLSNNVDINSLEIINASHNYTLEIIQNKILKFTFNNIRLSYDTLNISSTGFIAYKIKPKTSLALGNVIDNTAYIYFDYSEPIQTNTVQTQILLLSSINSTKNAIGKITIFPNPNNGNFFIHFESSTISNLQLELIDVTGKVMYQDNKNHQYKTEFSLSQTHLAKGIYWIKLTEGKEIWSSGIIVE